MPDQISQISLPRPKRRRIDPWSVGALVIAAMVMMPILAVVWLALTPTENIWPHLISTTLPRYLSNTFVLMLSVERLE